MFFRNDARIFLLRIVGDTKIPFFNLTKKMELCI